MNSPSPIQTDVAKFEGWVKAKWKQLLASHTVVAVLAFLAAHIKL